MAKVLGIDLRGTNCCAADFDTDIVGERKAAQRDGFHTHNDR
jgi:hypothetical protein